jgi:hypothetical protein
MNRPSERPDTLGQHYLVDQGMLDDNDGMEPKACWTILKAVNDASFKPLYQR